MAITAQESWLEREGGVTVEIPDFMRELVEEVADAARLVGREVVAPDRANDLVTREKIFLVDLQPDFNGQQIPLGTRAYVRVNHGGEALASQWYRRLRQVFLSQFNV